MMTSKMFHVGDLISIVKGTLVCPIINGRSHPIDGVYEILNFMSGDELYTHALPRVGDECKPVLLAEYPWLAEIEFPGFPDDFDVEWRKAEQEHHLAGNDREKYLSPGEMPPPDEPFAQQDIKGHAQLRWLHAIEVHDKARKVYFDKCNKHIVKWLALIAEKYGEYHEVWPLHPEDHEVIDPIDEMLQMNPDVEIIEISSEEPPKPEGNINW